MRKLLCVISILAFIASGLTAQENAKKGYNALGAKVLFMDYGTANSIDGLSVTNGLELQYLRNFNSFLNFAIPVKVGVANVANDINNRNVTSIDGILQIQYDKGTNRIIPYALLGGGYVWENNGTNNVQLPFGAGLNIRVGKNSFVNLQGEYRLSMEDNRNNLQAGLGYIYRIGKSDRDDDGIADALDKCPDTPGVKALDGCPDRDSDGVADADDLCPDAPGPKSTSGCPDADGDGFVDSKDDCPQTPGELKGCPDQDGDGISDKNDQCPDIAGSPDFNGCPDRDGDKIPDNFDECPDEPGIPSNNGCPIKDKDGDGVADDVDRCPDDPGPATTAGCPDRDNDNVPDAEDRCPDDPGQFAGCPDTDGDGLIDPDDSCPKEAGPTTNKGCPEIEEETQELLDMAMQAIQFKTGEAVILEESFPILDQIVGVMKQYKGYNLHIAGHTDNVGAKESNLVLSEKRAKACFQYLVNAGILNQRMTFKGYGEMEPIGDNRRTAGRKLNRRVEFQMFVK